MAVCFRLFCVAACALLMNSCGIVQPDGVLKDVMDGNFGADSKPPGREEEDAQRDLQRCMASSLCEEPHGMTFKLNP